MSCLINDQKHYILIELSLSHAKTQKMYIQSKYEKKCFHINNQVFKPNVMQLIRLLNCHSNLPLVLNHDISCDHSNLS